MSEVVIALKQRPWQKPLIRYFRERRKRAKPARGCVTAHRRAGKDRASLFIELESALQSPREIWHCLPEYAQARKVIWDAITRDGKRLIDEVFPKDIIAERRDHEMVIRLKTGALWRLVGADNFNSLVGSNPRHVTFSEFALTHTNAWEFVRPILAENGGDALFISTPRGYNHHHRLHEHSKKAEGWYHGFHPVSQTKLIPADVLKQERASMPDELYRQEYECDFSAANVGAILGSRIEVAEREGRINDELEYDSEQPVILSSDIGFRDATAWWFWQPRPDGLALIDYIEESGMDADEWIERLRAYDVTFGEVYMPHDARAKTFSTKKSALERFLAAGFKARLVPQVSIAHRVNAARMVLGQCRFHATRCAEGLIRLRNWSYKWDDERRVFSREPDHNEHSHGGDAFSYGALKLQQLAKPEAPKKAPRIAAQTFTLDKLWEDRQREHSMDDWR